MKTLAPMKCTDCGKTLAKANKRKTCFTCREKSVFGLLAEFLYPDTYQPIENNGLVATGLPVCF